MSLVCDAGAYTWAIADAITVDGGVGVAAGSYGLTGVAATLSPSRRLSCATGSYTWAIADTITFDLGLSLNAGSYALTGIASGVSAGRKLVAAAGSYSLSGVASALLRGRLVTAVTEAYSLNGIAAGILVQHKISVEAGVYTYFGVSAQLTKPTSNVIAPVVGAGGTYVGAGRKRRKLVAATGSYSLSGIELAVERGRPIAVALGVTSLAGPILVQPTTDIEDHDDDNLRIILLLAA